MMIEEMYDCVRLHNAACINAADLSNTRHPYVNHIRTLQPTNWINGNKRLRN